MPYGARGEIAQSDIPISNDYSAVKKALQEVAAKALEIDDPNDIVWNDEDRVWSIKGIISDPNYDWPENYTIEFSIFTEDYSTEITPETHLTPMFIEIEGA